MMNVNLAIWGLGVALQCVLLVALLTRGIARVASVFTALIAFYTVRSMALFWLSGRHGGQAYALVSGGLGMIDVLLQTMVAWELFSAGTYAVRPAGVDGDGRSEEAPVAPPLISRVTLFALFLVAAAGLTYGVARYLHGAPRAPLDRGVIFNSALFLLVFLALRMRKVAALIRPVMEGFAVFAGASILCQTGRVVAGAHRNAALFNGWTYAEAAAYLGVILYWIFWSVALPKVGTAVRGSLRRQVAPVRRAVLDGSTGA